MRAEILVPQSSAYLDARLPLLTYHVPETLAADIVPGQVVSVPFGERSAAGLVWALDAGEDTQDCAPSEPAAELRITAGATPAIDHRHPYQGGADLTHAPGPGRVVGRSLCRTPGFGGEALASPGSFEHNAAAAAAGGGRPGARGSSNRAL